MNLIRGIVGTLAVLFAAQPIANWSTNAGKKESEKQYHLTNGETPAADGDDGDDGGSPHCGGG